MYDDVKLKNISKKQMPSLYIYGTVFAGECYERGIHVGEVCSNRYLWISAVTWPKLKDAMQKMSSLFNNIDVEDIRETVVARLPMVSPNHESFDFLMAEHKKRKMPVILGPWKYSYKLYVGDLTKQELKQKLQELRY